jgi:hypothetical protein
MAMQKKEEQVPIAALSPHEGGLTALLLFG